MASRKESHLKKCLFFFEFHSKSHKIHASNKRIRKRIRTLIKIDLFYIPKKSSFQ